MNPYMRTIATNLAHFRPLIPPQPKRNLASNSKALPKTDDDAYLSARIHWGAIPEGRAGTARTLQTMAELARDAARDPRFQQFARQFSDVLELEQWMRDHFTYRDEQEEILRTPMFMLGDMGRMAGTRVVGLEGDCDDAATFLAAVVKVMGLPARFVAIRWNKSNPDFEHVFTEGYQNGEWITLDPTVEEGTVIHSVEDMTQGV